MSQSQQRLNKIFKVGLEFEYGIKGCDYQDFIRAKRIKPEEEMDRTFCKGALPIYGVLCKEWYPEQIELIVPFMRLEEANTQIENVSKNFFKNKKWRDIFNLELQGPNFVGTHAHFWISNIKDIITNVKFPIASMVLDMSLKYLKKDFAEAKKIKNVKEKEDAIKELLYTTTRLIRNHNIWIFMDSHFLENKLERNMQEICGFTYHYTGSSFREKRKNQPILWSLPKALPPTSKLGVKNKPLTLEIRMLSNYIIHKHPESFKKVCDIVEDCIKNNTRVHSIIHKKNLVKIHKDMCVLRQEIKNESRQADNTQRARMSVDSSYGTFRYRPSSNGIQPGVQQRIMQTEQSSRQEQDVGKTIAVSEQYRVSKKYYIARPANTDAQWNLKEYI